jgi:hypothetical protein
MTTSDPRLTHAALQTRIAKVRADAHDQQYTRMRWELDHLVDALTAHLAAESRAFDALPDAATASARDGQARIVSALTALTRAAAAGAQFGECESLAAALDDLLQRQDAVERRTLRSRLVATTQP